MIEDLSDIPKYPKYSVNFVINKKLFDEYTKNTVRKVCWS